MNSENKYSFEMIVDCLRCGREIEFSCHGEAFSITNSQGYWYFSCDTGHRLTQCICRFEDRESLIRFVREQDIDGIPLPEIFDNALYDALSLYIL